MKMRDISKIARSRILLAAALLTVLFGADVGRVCANMTEEYREAGFDSMSKPSDPPQQDSIRERLRKKRAELAESAVPSAAVTPPASPQSPETPPSGQAVKESQSSAVSAAPDTSINNGMPSQPRKDGSLWGSFKSLVGMGERGAEAKGAPELAAIEAVPPSPPAVPSDYVIGAGDLIGISVWRDDALTRSVVVLPDGKIEFPLVGQIVAGGKTVSQLKDELSSKLSRYMTDAELTVEVKQSNSMLVYVIGRVNSPGRHVLLARTNVLQALAMAGGLNPFASKNEIKVFRNENGATKMFAFAYGDVVEGKHLESNIELMRGDVIVVP